jgi:hypothetical protein
MRSRAFATLTFGLLFALALTTTLSCAQSSPKTIIVQASSDGGANSKQELELKGLKTNSSEAVGVRVFLDPGPDSKLDPNSNSYVGSIYFSHQKDPNNKNKEGNFVLPLRKRVNGATRVVMYPISGTGSAVLGEVNVREARIRSADNSVFQ